MTPLLDLQNLSRHYQAGEGFIRALDRVSLRIMPGEFVAVMGQSGSGKSTLMNVIGCLDRPTEGSYRVQGINTADLDPDALAALRRETFGFVFQRYNLLPTLTALGNVEIPAIYAGLATEQRKSRARQLLERLGMEDRTGHYPSQLSGGQQQRVAIARALMNDPPLILADEPTGALDSKSGAEVMQLLKELHASGRTVVLITHDRSVAEHAQRIIHLADGRVEQEEVLQDFKPIPITQPQRQSSMGFVSGVIEAVRMAFASLRSNFFRTALTLLGIVIGVASVVAMLAVGDGSKQKVLDQISTLGTNLLNIRPGGEGIRASGDIATLTLDDAHVIEDLPNVDVVVPERSGRMTVRFGNLDYATSVQGVGPGFPIARDWPLGQGVFFNQADLKNRAAVTVLGATVATTLFPNRSAVGQYVLVRNIPFEVIGVLSPKGAAPWGGDQDDVVFIPITTGLSRLFGGQHLNSLSVRVSDVSMIDETQERIRQLLISHHRVEDFRIRNTASIIDMATEAQNTFTLLLGTIAAISLIVGGIGVMNIMLVSVTERTREIGVRMATGARMRDIMLQFNIEAVVVCALGGVLGVALGFVAGYGAAYVGLSVAYALWPALLAFSSAFIAGVLFGYLPARKAARLDPVVALASE